MNDKLKIIQLDSALKPHTDILTKRMEAFYQKKHELLHEKSLNDFANGHLFYGFHQTQDGFVYREWAPNAIEMHLLGDFNDWNRLSHPLTKIDNENWEIYLSETDGLKHGTEVKVQVTTKKNVFDRIPLYIKRVIQKDDLSFNGQIWDINSPFFWTDKSFIKSEPLLIYECHIGISSEDYGIADFKYFEKKVLPRIKKDGYNAIQIMALLEHPYYGSFGYQVSNFFAVSSRFGTPEDLKNLVNTAHSMGIAVICDMVHSHACANTLEGINEFDGTDFQFFHTGEKGNHPTWGTKCFDYGKPKVIHFLLSNLKFWLEEYHLDGFRFDGVTSMLYDHHGFGVTFDNYQKYFSDDTDIDAIIYLQLANELIKEINCNIITIAEDVSGLPGMCLPVGDGGIGFDYRLSMGVPDYWIQTITGYKDEDWDMNKLWYELTCRRPFEKKIGYCESHDQAIVGNKTIMFWLADKEMYWNMKNSTKSGVILRAITLHKMIRLITFSLAGEGYMNFMGNEFGHPEWIDFPRKENGFNYHYARRQWSLADNQELLYYDLLYFDNLMLGLTRQGNLFNAEIEPPILLDNRLKLVVYCRGDFLFLFNFHPTIDSTIQVPDNMKNIYELVHSTINIAHNSILADNFLLLKRTAYVYKRIK